MDNKKIENLKESVRVALSGNPERFLHSLAVADMAMCLAIVHDYDMEKAYIAGILHDNAKYIGNDKQVNLCNKYGIKVSEVENDNPYLLHAKLGAYYAKSKYKVFDEEIAESIKWHTTGKPAMSKLEKIIYIADYIEPERHYDEKLDEIRKLAFVDLDQTAYLILKNTIKSLTQKMRPIDDTTISAYEYYKKIYEDKND